jgi:nucleotide-binding universal stress UspA family protein
MYENLLFPLDGSDGAAEPLHHTAEIAHWADAATRVLYVANTNCDSVTVVRGRAVDTLEQRGRDVVEEAARTLETLGVPYRTDVVQGNPAPTIAEYAEEYDQDLVVMPTLGKVGVSRYLAGSVSERTVRLSSVPVLSVRIRSDEQLTFPYEAVLVPTDGSEAASHAAECVLQLAAALDATVHALSVIDDSALGPDIRSSVAGGESEEAAAEAVERVVSTAEHHGVTDVVRHVKHGRPAEIILDRIETDSIHAVGMGTTGRRGAERILLGSVTEKTVRSAPVPVMTVAEPE